MVYSGSFYIQRNKVISKISEQKISESTKEITDFAYSRFYNLERKIDIDELQQKYN